MSETIERPVVIDHPRTAAAAIVRRHGITLVEARRFAAQQMAEACAAAGRSGARVEVAPPDGAAEPDPTLDIYEKGAPGPGAAAWWGRELFFAGDDPAAACPPSVDITGRGRILAFGPLIALPPATWRLCLRFELGAAAARHPWRLDFGAGAQMTSRQVQPGGGGLYEVALEAAWSDVALAEARIWVNEPAFHGELILHGGRIEWAGA